MVNALDSGFRGRGSNRVVSLSKAHLLPKSSGNTRKRWLRPNMTEKLFTWTLRINQLTNVYKLTSDNEFLARIFDCWEAGKIFSIQ